MQPPWQKYLDPRTLASVKGLSLRARRIVEGYIAGRHRGAASGFSIEFAEHREYVAGDDLRYVDWKVFGRTDKLYLKQFEDETNLACYLLLDVSKSMRYGEAAQSLSKLEYAKCIAASLAWLVLHQTDAVGLVTFDSEVRGVVAPSNGASQLNRILHELDQATVGQETSVAECLHDAASRFRRRGVMILLSDMLDDPEQVMLGLRHLRHNRHDVSVLHVLDRAELDFPFRGTTLFRGLESALPVTTDPVSVRQAYLREFGRFRQRLERGCADHRVQYHLTPTDQPMDETLSRILVAHQQIPAAGVR